MKKILLTILLFTASTFLYSQGMDLNHKKIHIVDSTMGLGITPTSRLHVFGNGTTSNLFNVTNDKDATKDSSVVINAVGNVGIGKEAPTAKLYVQDTTSSIGGSIPVAYIRAAKPNKIALGAVSISVVNEVTPDYNIGLYASSMGGTNNFAGYFNSGDVYINKNLGIGRLAPTYRLDVFGNGGTTDLFKVSNDINSTYDSTFVIKSNGFVGIGTETPKDYLDINGNITFPNNKYIFWNAYNKDGTIYQRDISGACVLMYQKTGNSDKLFNIDVTGANDAGNDTPIVGPISVLSVRTNAEINIHEEIMWRDSLGDYKKGTTLSDNETFALPTGYSWKGEIDVDSLGYTLFTAQIRCDANGTPYLEGVSWKRWSSKTYVEVGSTDGYLNITDGGSGMVITNTLGYTIKATLRFRTKQ
jgi:hypothetical protein